MNTDRVWSRAIVWVSRISSRRVSVVLAILAAMGMWLAGAPSADAQTLGGVTLHSFTNSGGDGSNPQADLIRDASGNLYGTTSQGGTNGYGTVFELVYSSGTYTEKVLYSFTNSGGDGNSPAAVLVMDASGNLYGTTVFGGADFHGIVFELVNSSGTYSEKVLHTFTNSGGDGGYPLAGLVMDASGNLYGTTEAGGTDGDGTVFELVNSSGTYSEKVLYSFTDTSADGASP
jgi:uncharacterized repeat protein (TIGR03803 family)